MECLNCHQEIAEGDAFCRYCGTKAPTPPAPCPTCGRVNEDDARFCVQCGTPLTSEGAPVADASTAAAPPVEVADTVGVTPPQAAEVPAPPDGPTAEAPASDAAEAATSTAPTPAAAAPAAPAPAAAAPAAPAPAAPATPTAAPGTATTATKTLTLVGAVAAAVGAFLAWLSANGDSANGFDVPVNFLFDYETTANHEFSAGLIVLLLAAAAGLAVLQPKVAARVPLLGLAIVILVVAGAYLGQLWRLTDDFGVSYTDYLGLGPIVAAVGGALILTRR